MLDITPVPPAPPRERLARPAAFAAAVLLAAGVAAAVVPPATQGRPPSVAAVRPAPVVPVAPPGVSWNAHEHLGHRDLSRQLVINLREHRAHAFGGR